MIYSTSFNNFHQYYDAEEAFANMAKVGYGACDLGLGLRKKLFDETDGKRVALLRSLPAIAKKYGVAIGQTHAAFFFETDCYDEAYIAEHIRLKKEEIRLTAELGCPYMVMHPMFFSGWAPNREVERSKRENIRILRELCDYAQSYGVTIALENMPGSPAGNFACSTAGELVAYIDEINAPNLGACLDFGHANVSVSSGIGRGEDAITRYVEILGERIVCLHVHDNTGSYDLHSLPLSISHGGIKWEEVALALKRVGYGGTFNAEVSFSVRYPKALFLHCEELQIAVLREISKGLSE